MASAKVVLRNKPLNDGTYPIIIRVIKDRKSSIISLGYSIHEKDWDKIAQCVRKSHPNAARLNNLLLKKLAEANDKLLELQTTNKKHSSKTVIQKMKPNGDASFFSQAKIFVDNLEKSGKYNRHKTEKGRIKIFREFVGSDLGFVDLNINLLNRFKAYLQGGRKIKERTITNYMMLIRTIYNQAIANGITDKNNYPFGKDKITIKMPDSIKIGWNAEEVQLLEAAELSPSQHHARNLWLISFYFAGMRLADVLKLKWSDFQDGRLHYAMSKNTKTGSLKISDKAQAILAQYKNDPKKHDLVFPELKELDVLSPYEVQRKIAFAGKNTESLLKRIAKNIGVDKNISMHIARHTFAQIASDKIPVQILQKLYRHTNITTTIGYQSNFTTKHTDDALDAVIGG